MKSERYRHAETLEITFKTGLGAVLKALETLEGNTTAWENMKAIYNKGISFLIDPKSQNLDYDKWLEEINQILSLMDEARKKL